MTRPFMKLFQTMPYTVVPSFACQTNKRNEALLNTRATQAITLKCRCVKTALVINSAFLYHLPCAKYILNAFDSMKKKTAEVNAHA
jgi:hypothetical protein